MYVFFSSSSYPLVHSISFPSPTQVNYTHQQQAIQQQTMSTQLSLWNQVPTATGLTSRGSIGSTAEICRGYLQGRCSYGTIILTTSYILYDRNQSLIIFNFFLSRQGMSIFASASYGRSEQSTNELDE